MVAIIQNIRSMSEMGILADRNSKTASLQLRHLNLVYGFNGSGKTTLSRVLGSLQAGTQSPRLPANCAFDIELNDGSVFSSPTKLSGLEQRILVFNSDFIEENVQWSSGRAKPVFYIGKEQAKFADELAAFRDRIPSSETRRATAASGVAAAEKSLQVFRRERARQVADKLRLRGRKYEAPQLTNDFEKLAADASCVLDDSALEAYGATCRLEEPPAKISEIEIALEGVSDLVDVRGICNELPSTAALTELEAHPSMLVWVKEGAEYHTAQSLSHCLLCSSQIPAGRLEAIRKALDSGIDRLLANIDERRDEVAGLKMALDKASVPSENAFTAKSRDKYKAAKTELEVSLAPVQALIEIAEELLADKKRSPGSMPKLSALPDRERADGTISRLNAAVVSVNQLIKAHNQDVDDFVQLQAEAREAIRKHYIAEGAAEYRALQDAEGQAASEATKAELAHNTLTDKIQNLENQVREHGPAADVINRMLSSYLGHSEISIAAVEKGYEIHRHGQVIVGLPSEGEKTAIALCYFLSMLESDGRKTDNLIVVIDDPVSSLDSRSLNFACSLIKSRLSDAAQLFVLTHNLNCVNEFRKAWKGKARAVDGKSPTATLLFLDVSMPDGKTRTSKIIDMPALLREYDSEYHYLFHHVLKFAKAQGQYDYAYMMPNVLRRVLDVFLAFRCPGSAPLPGKIEQLCKAYKGLDKDRIVALERLAQVESHSDSLDDLISFSSMTLEETKDATNALLAVMDQVDKDHLEGLRRICR